MLVVHDDIDLAFGRLRIKKGSSDGGHNGIKSTNRVLDPEDYYKLKVGVGDLLKELTQLILYYQSFIMRKGRGWILDRRFSWYFKYLLKDKELAIKEASERRIIDVI